MNLAGNSNSFLSCKNTPLKIDNLEKVIDKIEVKFLSASPHLTVSEAPRGQLRNIFTEKNSALKALGKKLACDLTNSYLPGFLYFFFLLSSGFILVQTRLK